jgi:hypothetical protein
MMNYQEMLTLLLALVLFTSIAMVANNNLMTQSDFLHDSFYQLQALQIAQRYMDRIDERLYADAIRLSAISSLYDGENEFYFAKENMIYTINITSTYVDSLGTPANTITSFYRVNLIITSQPDVISPIRISRIYGAF